MTAPAWRQVWVFRENIIVRRFGVGSIGWSKRFPLYKENTEPILECIELHRAKSEELEGHPIVTELRPTSKYALYFLALIRPSGKELLRIDCLTEGEARWLADVLFEEFPAWFR